MSHFLDRLSYFSNPKEPFSGDHGVTTGEDRTWEDAYRNRWAHDKIVRSTHGVNCTGSCSWKIYVKGGIVTWETQQTDYPRTRWDMPNHEPRGCARGASYSWYLYSANRVKYPMVRGRLLKRWRAARLAHDPVAAWTSIVEDDAARRDYQSVRGLGGFVRSSWDEVNEIIAAANVYTIKKYGPDRVVGFSPIPAMSMVSYAAGSRYLSLIGGVCMSFYDWYCDLPPSSPQIWGEQTDVPESADWYNSNFIIAWGSQRAADAHARRALLHRGPLQGDQDGRGDARLLRSRQAGRHLDAPEAGHRRRGGDGDGPRDPEGVLLSRRRRAAQRVLRRLRAALHRHADAGDAEGAQAPERRDRHGARPLRPRVGLQRQARPGEQSRVEDRRVRRGGQGRAAQRRDRLPLGAGRTRRPGPVEPRGEGGAPRPRREAQAVGARRREPEHGHGEGRLPVLRRHRQRALPEQRAQGRQRRRAGAHGAGPAHRAGQGRREARGAGRHGVRPAGRELRRRARAARRVRRDELRRRHAVHARVAGAHHGHAARAGDHGGAAVRRERAQDAGPVDGDHRRGDEPLVPLRHELPRHHQHADAVRLHRQERRRLGALRRAGEAAAADGLDGARVRARLDPSAAPAEQHELLLRAHRPVALREADDGRGDLAARRPKALRRQHDRLQRARRAHGLAAVRAAAADQSAAGRARRAGRRRRSEGVHGQGAEGRLAEDELRGSRTIRTTGRATSSCGARTCWARAARATSTS